MCSLYRSLLTQMIAFHYKTFKSFSFLSQCIKKSIEFHKWSRSCGHTVQSSKARISLSGFASAHVANVFFCFVFFVSVRSVTPIVAKTFTNCFNGCQQFLLRSNCAKCLCDEKTPNIRPLREKMVMTLKAHSSGNNGYSQTKLETSVFEYVSASTQVYVHACVCFHICHHVAVRTNSFPRVAMSVYISSQSGLSWHHVQHLAQRCKVQRATHLWIF